ncbi:CCAAT/enhancer-binding protein delta [Plakobranchus ocellatus]|uniref:CCAAT/enhancer-binding protein delta n=1 Tax=Plakobranchus ocellatus TaxID=259542 RepID=A0AAV4DLK4_9GAST|nr:CCAAT/enhancer-binding protein delta [Plakobranchus ocellatus]
MVRIVGQNFSPQRSRHSSGETDKYLAERASSALGLSVFGKKKFDIPECESSSDSFWDSEIDGDHHDTVYSEQGEDNNDINGNETLKKSNAQSKRKERRRERNKLSAQAYRQRRRSQNMKEQQQLLMLEAENKRLHQLVDTLEKKTEQTKQYLRGCSVPMPDVLLPPTTTEAAACGGAASLDPNELSQNHHLNVHSPTANFHSIPNNTEATSSSPSPAISPHPNAAKPSLPLTQNMNLGINMPNNSYRYTQNEKFVSGASTFNAECKATTKNLPLTQHPLNANSLMQSQRQNSSATRMPTFEVRTLMAIPVEYDTAVTNYNLNSQTHNKKSKASNSAENTMVDRKYTVSSTSTSPVVNAIMFSINGNPPPPGTVYNIMNVEMCNNNGVSGNMYTNTDKKSFAGCDNTNPGGVPGSPVTVNLNEVKISGEPLQLLQALGNSNHLSH